MLDISKYLEAAKAQIKAEEERQVTAVKNAVAQEVVPYNQEVDKLKNDSINKLTLKYSEDKNALTASFNEQINALNAKFEDDKRMVNEAANKKKQEHVNTLLASRTYEVTSVCDKALARLTSQIDELKD